MSKESFSCPHPDDPEGCRRALIEAHRRETLAQHCMIEGLRRNFQQCRQVLLEGLKEGHSQTAEPCKQVVLVGFPLEIPALEEIFYEAYYRIVRSRIYRFGIQDTDQPSADDVFQTVFVNLIEHFRRGDPDVRSLSGYVRRSTFYECLKVKKQSQKYLSLGETQHEIEDSQPYITFLPPRAVEKWEQTDDRLLRSRRGSLINRIILAQRALEGYLFDDTPSAKQLKADWQQLGWISDGDVSSLHGQTVRKAQDFGPRAVVPVAAEMINSGLAEPPQVAILFAAATGMNLPQTRRLLDDLNKLSETAVYTRISHILGVIRLLESLGP